jgi:MFS family permease
VERSIWAVTAATFTLRFATGFTGALLIFFLADLPGLGGPAVGPLTIGVFTALFFAAELILSPPFGLMSDRIGHHRVMQIGPLFGFAAVILTAITAEIRLPGSVVIAIPVILGSLPLLAFTRVLEGASTAASVPSTLGFIAMATARDESLRGRASARFEAATIAGLALGFAVAGPAWEVLGPTAFLANSTVYVVALLIFRYAVHAPEAPAGPGQRPAYGWSRYTALLRRAHVWLLAPTWIALNAAIGLYTSQTLFQLIRKDDLAHPDQILVGGFTPLMVTATFMVGAIVLFVGLWYWGGRFGDLRRTTIIFYGIVGGGIFAIAALLFNHSGSVAEVLRLPLVGGLGVGLFMLAGATPAALGLLADMTEAFPDDRGAIMGLYGVFLALGQIIGAAIGGVAASFWALDGILLATVALLAVALMPLTGLRSYETRFERSAVPGASV